MSSGSSSSTGSTTSSKSSSRIISYRSCTISGSSYINIGSYSYSTVSAVRAVAIVTVVTQAAVRVAVEIVAPVLVSEAETVVKRAAVAAVMLVAAVALVAVLVKSQQEQW